MVYVFFADGFEEIEAITPVDVLRRAGETVKTVGVTGKTVVSSHNVPVQCDIGLDELVLDDSLRMVVLPGGEPGTTNLKASGKVKETVQFAVDKGVPVGAICAAPSLLGGMGLLEGKTATCFPSYADQLLGANYTGEAVVCDGLFTTARGAGVALDFALALVEKLHGKATADKLAAELQCK